jgi:hypothetical protein
MRLDYMQRIYLGMGLIRERQGTGVVIEAQVAHDDYCKMSDKKPCNCAPDVVLKVGGENYHVDEDGYPKLRV